MCFVGFTFANALLLHRIQLLKKRQRKKRKKQLRKLQKRRKKKLPQKKMMQKIMQTTMKMQEMMQMRAAKLLRLRQIPMFLNMTASRWL